MIAKEILKRLPMVFGLGHKSDYFTNKGGYFYSGHYQNGKAKYYYDEISGEKVLNGEFEYEEIRNDFPSGKVRLRVHGKFADNKKVSLWTYESKRDGEKRKLCVEYADGMHEGLYSFRFKRSGSVLMFNTAGKLDIHMHQGHPVGKINGFFNRGTFEGFCDDEGLPDDVWSMDYSKTSLSEVCYDKWENGVLKNSYSLNLSTGEKMYRDEAMIKFFTGFVFRECYSLESILPNGSDIWDGSIVFINDLLD